MTICYSWQLSSYLMVNYIFKTKCPNQIICKSSEHDNPINVNIHIHYLENFHKRFHIKAMFYVCSFYSLEIMMILFRKVVNHF